MSTLVPRDGLTGILQDSFLLWKHSIKLPLLWRPSSFRADVRNNSQLLWCCWFVGKLVTCQKSCNLQVANSRTYRYKLAKHRLHLYYFAFPKADLLILRLWTCEMSARVPKQERLDTCERPEQSLFYFVGINNLKKFAMTSHSFQCLQSLLDEISMLNSAKCSCHIELIDFLEQRSIPTKSLPTCQIWFASYFLKVEAFTLK